MDDIKEKRGYCKLEEEALDRNLQCTPFGRGYGAVVKADNKINELFVHQNGHIQAHTLNRITAKVNENKYYLI